MHWTHFQLVTLAAIVKSKMAAIEPLFLYIYLININIECFS